MATLTDAQKKRLKAHSKHHTIAHVKKMAKLMREGKSFSKAHTAAMKTDPPKQKQKQKQKQTQSQRVVVNVGTIPRRRGRRPAAKPRPMSYQQDTSRLLGQFSPLPPYTPPPLINDMPRPMPFQEATRTPVRVANEFAVRPPVATGQMLSGLPAVSPPLAPPSSLQRQSSAAKLGRSVSQIGEMVGSIGAAMNNPDPLRAEDVAEYKRLVSATEGLRRAATPSLDFRTAEGKEKKDLADAFRGKTLARTAFQGFREAMPELRAENQERREEEQMRAIAARLRKDRAVTTAAGGGGGGGGSTATGGGSLVAPRPGPRSNTRFVGQPAEEGGY